MGEPRRRDGEDDFIELARAHGVGDRLAHVGVSDLAGDLDADIVKFDQKPNEMVLGDPLCVVLIPGQGVVGRGRCRHDDMAPTGPGRRDITHSVEQSTWSRLVVSDQEVLGCGVLRRRHGRGERAWRQGGVRRAGVGNGAVPALRPEVAVRPDDFDGSTWIRSTTTVAPVHPCRRCVALSSGHDGSPQMYGCCGV
jgi:hypothetical protein